MQRLEKQQEVVNKSNTSRNSRLAFKRRRLEMQRNDKNLKEKNHTGTVNYFSLLKAQIMMKGKAITGKGFILGTIVILIVFLCIIHIFLRYKLYTNHEMLHTHNITYLDQYRSTISGLNK